MQLSIFEVLGPVMIGPSSSHTAGAAKLARVAAIIAAKPFQKVYFGLSGSFAETGLGHGTHKALLAGALGFVEDDERIRDAEAVAMQQGIQYGFAEEDLEDMHENSVHIVFSHKDESKSEIWGSSIGGGRIVIHRIGGFETEITAESPTMVIQHLDRPGVVSDVTRLLAENHINIAVMRLSRQAKGKRASLTVEVDGHISKKIAEHVGQVNHVTGVIVIDVP